MDKEQHQYSTPNLFSSIIGRKFYIKGRSFNFLDVLNQKKDQVLVCKCLGDDGRDYVVKIIKLDDEYKPSADPNCTYSDGYQVGEWRFADTVAKLFDSSVVIYEVSEQIGNEIVLVSEYRGIDMQRYGEHKGELFLYESLEILIRITNALQRIHKQNIIHCDVKPSNIFINIEETKYSFDIVDAALGDLGIARRISSQTQPINTSNTEYSTPTNEANTYTLHNGSLGYIAPECFKGKQCLLSDVWSLGRAMLWLLFARNKQTMNRMQKFFKIDNEKHRKYQIDEAALLHKLYEYFQQTDFNHDSKIIEIIDIGNLEKDVRGWKEILFIIRGMLDEPLETRFTTQKILIAIFERENFSGQMNIVHQINVLNNRFRENRLIQLFCALKGVLLDSLVDKNDKEIVLEVVKHNGDLLEYIDGPLKKDREIVLEAVKQSGLALQYADESLKKDREIVLQAVKHSGLVELYESCGYGTYRHALDFADESFKKDREILLEAVKHNRDLLEYIDESLKKDREIVLEAVKQSGLALQYADESLKKDREIVMEAIKRNANASQYIDASWKNEVVNNYNPSGDSLKTDRNFDVEVFKFILEKVVKQNYSILPKYIMKDREIIFKAVRKYGHAIRFADESLKKDREIVLEAVKQYGYAIQYVDESFRKDREIVLVAVKNTGDALQYVDESLKKDREIVLEAVKKSGIAFQYADESLKHEKETVLKAVKFYGGILDLVDESLKKDRELVLEAVKQSGFALRYADKSLKKDRHFMLEAVAHNGYAIRFADESLQNDVEMLKAVKHNEYDQYFVK